MAMIIAALISFSLTPAFPSVLSFSDFFTRERLNRQQPPNPHQSKNMFCGMPANRPRGRPQQVCLHAEETREVEPVVSFDVDSFLGFASSLAVTQQVLRHQLAPQAQQNQQMDVDINTTVYAAAEDPEAALQSRTAMRKDMPHCYLGRVEGASEISLYVLFPHLTNAHGDCSAPRTTQSQ